MNRGRISAIAFLCTIGFASWIPAFGWDEEGHVLVTRLAVEGLPSTMPAWLREPAVRNRLDYLSVEPDRWRGQDNVQLDHINKPDHFMDEEHLYPYGLSFRNLPPLRREFTDLLASKRALKPEAFEAVGGSGDSEYTRGVPGLLPYAIAELQWKVASSWSTLKAYEKHRAYVTDEMIRNARANVVYHMGILSHFVGDGAQPLHTTQHFNGWVGDNPQGYTKSKKIHSYIDSGVLEHHGIDQGALKGRARPATKVSTTEYWRDICDYLSRTKGHVEPLYALQKSGELNNAEGKQFIEERLLDGGAMLAGVWVAAYEGAIVDEYLERKLTQGQREVSEAGAKPGS